MVTKVLENSPLSREIFAIRDSLTEALGRISLRVRGLEFRDELRRVVAAVLRDDGGQLAEGVGEALHGVGLLAGRHRRRLVHGVGHQHLAAA